MRILIAPLNIASQPYNLARGLRRFGIDAQCLQYGQGDGGHFKYQQDRIVNIGVPLNQRGEILADTLADVINDFDIYHFFQRSLFFGRVGQYDRLTGFDIPLLKARGKKIVYRFTGFEVIDRQMDLQENPYSPFRYGFDPGMDEILKKPYLEFLNEYVDEFMVADQEMQLSWPKAKVVPRCIDVNEWPEVGISKTDKPLVLHAPTTRKYKGTDFVLAAFEDLKKEGIQFEVKLLERAPHDEAIEWYKKADIIVDQLHVGWYGVLALECMAMGKPVMVYMREDLAKSCFDEVPIENVNPDNIKDKLKNLIRDQDKRSALSNKARAFVEKHHDMTVVIPQLIEIYQDVYTRNFAEPRGFADVEYLRLQRQLIDKSEENRLVLEKNLRTIHKDQQTELNNVDNLLNSISIKKILKTLVKRLKSGLPQYIKRQFRLFTRHS